MRKAAGTRSLAPRKVVVPRDEGNFNAEQQLHPDGKGEGQDTEHLSPSRSSLLQSCAGQRFEHRGAVARQVADPA
nr:hypothetical protein CFP56_12308 [Quercus suber]